MDKRGLLQQSPRLPTTAVLLSCKLEVPMTRPPPPALIWLFATKVTETLSFRVSVYCIIKDTDEQPDEEIHRVLSLWEEIWKGSQPRNFYPMKMGWAILPVPGYVHQSEAPRTPVLLGFSRRLPCVGISSSSPLSEEWGWG